MKLESLRRRYAQLSYWVTATFLAFVFVNVVLGGVFAGREFYYHRLAKQKRADILAARPGQPVLTQKRTDYQMKWLDQRAFSAGEQPRLDQVLTDFFEHEKLGYRFSPYTHYSNVPFQSPTLNVVVNESGFDHRLVPNAKGDKNKVFLFGGSTTFGTHVADDWTLASYLQSRLPSHQVFNFGRANYSWFQEMVLFQRLLHAGYRPKIAVFIDGVNVFSEDSTPVWSDKMQTMWEEAQILPQKRSFPDQIPIFRLVNFVSQRRRNATFEEKMARRNLASTKTMTYFESYTTTLEQLRALGKQFGVQMLFILQPNRAVNCNSVQYSRPLEESYTQAIQSFYDSLRDYRAKDFANFSGLCSEYGKTRLAFVDDVHYSPSFNEFLSARLEQYAKLRRTGVEPAAR